MNAIAEIIEAQGNKRVADLLAPYFDDIERAIASGVTHQIIIETLAAKDIKLTLATFRGTFYRMRKARSKDKNIVTRPNSPVVKPASHIPDAKKNSQQEPTHSSQSTSGGQKSWREMKKQHVEW